MTDRPHPALRVEARLHGVLERALAGRGWAPHVVPHLGYGTTSWIRVLARVVLAPPGVRRLDPEESGDDPADDPGLPRDVRGWRRFVSASAVGVPVTVTAGGSEHEVVSDRDGYVDAVVPVALPPGWQPVSVQVTGAADAPGATAYVRVVGPQTRLGLVSDIDDTVIVTMLPRPLVAFRNAFLARESTRRPVPGMARLYAEVTAAHPEVFVVYVSTGAWNTAAPLSRFLHHHGFPRGPLLLTDWGPTPSGWFRSGAEHKHTALRRLLDELPDLSWLLVGDDGQHDPAIYGELAAASPDRVVAIAIRELSLGEQVVGHGTTTTRADVPDGRTTGVEVRARDGFGLRDALLRRGLLSQPPFDETAADRGRGH